MNTREEVENKILEVRNNNILLEYPTSFGKTKIALELAKKRVSEDSKILVVIPKLALINNWKEEFVKWDCEHLLERVTFVTYISFPKKAGNWDMVIFDEAHHLSERCRDALCNFNIKNSILLSATVGKNLRYELSILFPKLYIHRIHIKDAISEGVLPTPTVYLLPLMLDNKIKSYTVVKNKSKGNVIKFPYEQKFKIWNIKDRRIELSCTQLQYYNEISGLISFYKRKSHVPMFKNLYLHACGERLKWLSELKTGIVKNMIDNLSGYRILTFCSSIEQTELLGKYCINSKNRQSLEYLDKFNNHKIDHITACGILDEGVNLKDCRIGIYAALNNSERMIKQRLGRLLRHQDPIIIIPYFKNTRDQELVVKMCENYEEDKVKFIKSVKDIKL